jgi:hypothetical protein
MPRVKKYDAGLDEIGWKLIECQSYQLMMQRYLKLLFNQVPLYSNFTKSNPRILSIFTHSPNYKAIIETHLDSIKEAKLVTSKTTKDKCPDTSVK